MRCRREPLDPRSERRPGAAKGTRRMSAPDTTVAPAALAPTAVGPTGLWADLRAALRGTNADYTRIPLKRAVLLLAVPMMLELVLESTFAVVDIFFVAKLGSSAVATVGLDRDLPVPAVLDRDGAGDGGHRHRRAARRRATRRRRGAVGRAGHRRGGAGVAAVCAGRHRLGAGPAAADGRRCLVHRTRLPLHAVDARRQRGDPAAVRHQRHLPRRRRCGGGDARAVGGQCAEHRARPDPDLRARAGSGAGHRRRGHRHQPRARRGRADAAVDPAARQRTPAHAPRQPALARRDDAADRAHLARRHRPDDRRDDGLDLPDAHPGQHFHRSRCRRDDHAAHHDVHADAGLGHVQRRRHAGRAEPGRGRARRAPRPRSGASAG